MKESRNNNQNTPNQNVKNNNPEANKNQNQNPGATQKNKDLNTGNTGNYNNNRSNANAGNTGNNRNTNNQNTNANTGWNRDQENLDTNTNFSGRERSGRISEELDSDIVNDYDDTELEDEDRTTRGDAGKKYRVDNPDEKKEFPEPDPVWAKNKNTDEHKMNSEVTKDKNPRVNPDSSNTNRINTDKDNR